MFKSSTVVYLLTCLLGIHGYSYEEQGYQHIERLGGWLKMQARPRTWRVARIQCHLEGAFLATPWSPEFVAAINQLQNSYRGKENVSSVYSGVFETDPEGAYSVIEGSLTISLDPRDMAQYERCGVIFANGTTSTISCIHSLPFVCFAPRTSTADLDPPASELNRNLTSAPVVTQNPVSTLTTDDFTQDPVSTLTPDDFTEDPDSLFITEDTDSTLTPDDFTEDPVVTLATHDYNTDDYDTTSIGETSTTSPVSTPTGCDESSGYKYESLAERCYKIHSERMFWTDANSTCNMEGAHLLVINSEDESWVIMKMIRTKILNSEAVFVGVYRKSAGEWMTVTGEPLAGMEWDEWDYEEPDNGPEWKYAYFLRNGKLYTGTKNYLRPFICEMAPQTIL